MKKIFKSNLVLSAFLLLILITVPLYYQILRPGFFPMQDDLQAFRTHQMIECLKDFQIPCRWIPDMGYQYGYPQFNFYPPSVYYLGALFYFLGLQIIDSVKLVFILGIVCSTLTMFFFLKSWLVERHDENWKDLWPPFVGAVLYSYVPYKASQIYVRGSLNEFWSLSIFPMIFWAALQLIKTKKPKYMALLAIFISLLLLTHNLMSLIFFPIAGIWMSVLIVIYKCWSSIPKLILSAVLGLMLAGFFTFPVIFEGKYVHLETLIGGYFDYRQHFVPVNKLFISNHFGYGSSGFGQDNDLSLSTGQVQWMLGLFGVALGLVTLKNDRKFSLLIGVLGILTLFVLFLIHQKSSFIWEQIPAFKYLQFPWRFLSISIFLLSLLDAAAIYLVYKKNQKVAFGLGIVAIIVAVFLHTTFFTPKEWLNISDEQKFSGQLWEKQLTISIFDYLPIYATLPPNHKAPDKPEVLEGKVTFMEYKKFSNHQFGKVEVFTPATIRLPLFDFPGMRVKVNGMIVEHINNDCRLEEYCFGLITFNLNPGVYDIEARLTDTPVRTIGNISTLLGIIIIVGIFLKPKYENFFK